MKCIKLAATLQQPAGQIKVLSEEWWELVEHAIREGGRLGVNIGMFNCPGWSQCGQEVLQGLLADGLDKGHVHR